MFPTEAIPFSTCDGSTNDWTGLAVPRILPRCIHEDAFAQHSCSSLISKRRMEPSSLWFNRGIAFHPFLCPATVRHDNHEEIVFSSQNSSTFDHQESLSVPVVDDQSEMTTVDLFFFPQTSTDNTTTGSQQYSVQKREPLHIRMDRNSQEDAYKTLQRMAISVNKQMAKSRGKIDKASKSKARATNHNREVAATLWKILPLSPKQQQKKQRKERLEKWNVQGLSNIEVWKAAINTPLLVEIPVNTTRLALRVESCPPTVVAVRSFEGFTALTFCHVPLVVEVDVLFATHAIVDWFVDGRLVCSNGPSYTPQEADIGKYVSILITPVVRRSQTGEFQHKGRGYEEAYQFENPVQALEPNTILNLRRGPIWTNPNRRTLEQCESSANDATNSNGELTLPISPPALRVLTYNILADQNSYKRGTGTQKVSFYPYVPENILDKARRMPLLVHEILAYQADIICLQEVDESIFESLFRPVLEYSGYQGYYNVKESKGSREGCAMFWSLHRFESIPKDEMRHFVLRNLLLDPNFGTIMDDADASDNHSGSHYPLTTCKWESAPLIAEVFNKHPDLKDVIETKLGHIVQMASLKFRTSNHTDQPPRMLVANTHLFYHPRAAHIRLMQMYAICRQLERERQRHQEGGTLPPFILCGDMNTSLRRAACYLLMNREVLSSHSQVKEHFNIFQWRERDDEDQESVTSEATPEETKMTNADSWTDFPSVVLPDAFPIIATGYHEEPAFTHYLPVFAAALDHVFISQDTPASSRRCLWGLAPLESAPMPSVEDVTQNVGMPSEFLPSDHVSLAVDLVFTKLTTD